MAFTTCDGEIHDWRDPRRDGDWGGPSGASRASSRSPGLLLFAMSLLAFSSSRSLAETTETSPTPSLFQRLCATNACRNGECYLVNSQVRCVCDVIYRGTRCQYVNLDQVEYALIGSVVIFQWPRPPRLRGYSFVYYEPGDSTLVLNKHTISMSDHENSVLVGDLKGGKTHYRICIEDDSVAERALSIHRVGELSNCLELTTQPDYHTLVGWVLLLLLACCAVLLMYSQRQKIEILYFSRPYVPQMEAVTNEPSSQSQSRSQSHTSLSKHIPNNIQKEA